MVTKGLEKMVYVTWLDGAQQFSIQPKTKGKELLEQVAKAIDLAEIWYFGLQFTDSGGNAEWVNLKKKVLAQDVKNQSPLQLKLRVRFHPEDTEVGADPRRHQEALIPAGEGGHSLRKHLLALQMLPRSWTYAQKSVSRATKGRGCDRVKIAQMLDMFGVTYFKMKDKKEAELWLGVDAVGVKIYPKDNKLTPVSRFLWAEGKRLTIETMGRSGPSLILYAEQSRDINKRILELIRGHHLLHTRRQEPDSAEVQQLKARAREQSLWKR